MMSGAARVWLKIAHRHMSLRSVVLPGIVLLILAIALGFAHAKEPGEPVHAAEPGDAAATAQRDVRAAMEALYSGDIDGVLKFTFADIRAAPGGADALRSAAAMAVKRIRQGNMRIESFTFPEPPTVVNSKFHDFAIVPTLIIISANGLRIESRNFQFGVRKPGAGSWAFIDGAHVDSSILHQIFPDFPGVVQLPLVTKRRL
ncbi:MAG: hypothetical protein IT485_08125 [Gammaproteobacteria bacterium]|nr:hypothetical protein [Gammaproteobacteria bacterium]QOJ32171.1 MAG: hypothetical protein HRU81_08705 [Gammaproteobacteria bacterium]